MNPTDGDIEKPWSKNISVEQRLRWWPFPPSLPSLPPRPSAPLPLLSACARGRAQAGDSLLDDVLDDLNELVPEVPKVHTRGGKAVTDPAVVFGLDASLWRSSLRSTEGGEGSGAGAGSGAEGVVRAASDEEAEHMAVEAECYHVLPRDVPDGWSATRARLEALMKAAPADDLYRTKGVVPLSAAEAAAEAARQGLPPPAADAAGGAGTNLGDTWWLFNGVAGRLTLEQLHHTAGPTSVVFMGHGLEPRLRDIDRALGLPSGSVTRVSAVPPVKFGERLIACGVARGLTAPDAGK